MELEEGYKVINADEELTVKDYKNYLQLKHIKVKNIRRCNMKDRNLF